MKKPRPVVLCILDGWGHRIDTADNSIQQAKTPHWHRFLATSPHALLEASELFVGLPEGQMGNSEVGHTNLGAGRVVMQDLPRIDQAIKDGSLARNPALTRFIETLRQSGGTAHILGLLSPGGVHSHQDHLAALARTIAETGVPVSVHAFLDGRDSPPKSALSYLAKFEADLAGVRNCRIATVTGRFYAMDRDQRWDRVEQAYGILVEGKGEHADSAQKAVEQSYAKDKNDEFVAPTRIGDFTGMRDGDGLVMANFRSDRARELLAALLDPAFTGFERSRQVRFAAALGMVQYSTALDPFLDTLFPPEKLDQTFGEVIAEAGLTQLRIAETEKYAHVTFFFNGGRETEFKGESRILVPSPKVATYDLKPEMSAEEVTDRLVDAIDHGRFDVIVVNYANTDMVGHSGDIKATIKAVETVDHCLGRLAESVTRAGGTMLITADHGNAETMRDPVTQEPHTAHTTNPVPLVLVSPPSDVTGLSNGRLADVAPTLLAILGLRQPTAMTGHPLLLHAAQRVSA